LDGAAAVGGARLPPDMSKILFVRESMLDHGVQLSTNHLFRAATELGHETLWLTRPATPLTLFNAVRSPAARHRIGVALASLAGTKARQLSFFTPIIRKRQLGLTGRSLLRNMVRFALPPVRAMLNRRNWREVDVLWLSDPYLSRVVEMIPHRKLVFQVTDDYTKFANFGTDLEGELGRIFSRADAVFFTNRALLADYLQRFEIEAARCAYIGHGMDRYAGRQIAPPTDDIKAVYIGALNDWIDWNFLDALRQRLPRLRIDFFGQAAPQIQKKLQHLGDYRGYLPRESVGDTLSAYHFGLIPFRRSELKAFSEPMKLYDYIGSGLPVLSTIDVDPMFLTAFPGSIVVANDPDSAVSVLARSGADYVAMRSTHLRAAEQFTALNSWQQRFTAALEFVDAKGPGIPQVPAP
jgi:hypothetical protein